MCTVSYIPKSDSNDFVLTSNRDEKSFRSTISPAIYTKGEKKLVYPKDEKAGGSWIAINNSGKICCLLNGAYVAHQKQKFHTLSRGTILLELTASELSAHDFFTTKELGSVEPFTLVTIEQNNGEVDKLTDFVWDGKDKYFRQLDKNIPYIWSSATLYNDEHRKLRKEWFSKFYTEFRNDMSSEKILSFHSGVHTDDSSVNVVMQREGGLKTVSITQVLPEDGQLKMTYNDLLNNSIYQVAI